jgi:MFS-type transporter involved in bile tolerance (Atg22 family)
VAVLTSVPGWATIRVARYGKAAAIAGPYLFGYLLDVTGATVWSLTFVAVVMAAGALITLFGRETRGAKLT